MSHVGSAEGCFGASVKAATRVFLEAETAALYLLGPLNALRMQRKGSRLWKHRLGMRRLLFERCVFDGGTVGARLFCRLVCSLPGCGMLGLRKEVLACFDVLVWVCDALSHGFRVNVLNRPVL